MRLTPTLRTHEEGGALVLELDFAHPLVGHILDVPVFPWQLKYFISKESTR